MKNSIVSLVIGALVGVVIWVVSRIVVMALMLPGLRALKRARTETTDLVSNAVQGSVVYKSKLSSNIDQDEVATLKVDMAAKLVEEGLSEELAGAFTFFRSRLMWTPEQWDEALKNVESLMAQGYNENAIRIHLILTESTPSPAKLGLLLEMVEEQGIQDHEPLRAALQEKDYTVEDFEEAIRLHDVHEMDWNGALTKSFLK